MSQIKFRAWDKKSSRYLDENDNTPNFLEVEPCDTTGEFRPMYMMISESKIYDTDIDIQMFTGLLDKNDKDVYEGDLISDGLFVLLVEWGASGWVCGESDLWQFLLDESPIRYGVIGNIWENGDLLK